MLHLVRPAVPGTLGEPTVLDTTTHPPRVVGPLHYEIDTWFGDDLITSHPCYLVTEKLATALAESGLERIGFRDVEMTYGEDAFQRLQRHDLDEFPVFRWLVITGTAGHDDIGLTARGRLVVSDAALAIIRQGNLGMAKTSEYDPDVHR